MGHVKQKKSTSSSTSTPPEVMTIEVVNTKEKVPHAMTREHHQRPSYPEQLNAVELISQINCRSSMNEIANDSNNNSNSNNNTIHRTLNQLTQGDAENIDDDVENGPVERHRRQRPLYRRLISFIRNLWIGAKFTVGKDGKRFVPNSSTKHLFDYDSRRTLFYFSFTKVVILIPSLPLTNFSV
jgi:glycosidase